MPESGTRDRHAGTEVSPWIPRHTNVCNDRWRGGFVNAPDLRILAYQFLNQRVDGPTGNTSPDICKHAGFGKGRC